MGSFFSLSLSLSLSLSQMAAGEQEGFPKSSNMRALKWNDELAATAQRWADQCKFAHDKPDQRFV